MFSHIPPYAGDPVLSLNEEFQTDTRSPKVNLSIGVYFDDTGKLPTIRAVRKVESTLQASIAPHPYLPMAGHAQYREVAQKVVFGADLKDRLRDRLTTIQTLGGSGALKVGADFLKHYFPQSHVWASDPTWDNHKVLFEGAGFAVNHYPYYDPQSGGVRFTEMLETLDRLPAQSIVLLHACCHNPTGVDLSGDQWAELAPIFLRRNLIAFVDMAYQGFGSGIDEDAAGVRLLAEAGVPLLVASSFSKNFSLYGERCGALSVACASAAEAERVLGQLNAKVRANYSNPPTYGATLISRVLSDEALTAEWTDELHGMRTRMLSMRSALHARLDGKVDDSLRARYINQRGMFTYTGLNKTQVDRLKNEFAIYLVNSGRMCVAGLSESNVDYVASSIAVVAAADTNNRA
jgi:aromatic-amino-acid transaminase